MPNLYLLRHLKSQWNIENRFAGWTDGVLSKNCKNDAEKIAKILMDEKIDKIYSSSLFRNMDTIARIYEFFLQKYPFFIHLDKGKMKKWGNYEDISENDVSVYISDALNERYYGRLQGLNKDKTMEKYSETKVRLWRRSYNVAPPGGESEKDVYKRVIKFFKKYPEKDLKSKKDVLIVASHNPLRALAKHVEKISDEDIINFEISYGGLIKYELDDLLKLMNKKVVA